MALLKTKSQHSLWFRLLRVAAILLLLIFFGFYAAALASKTLGSIALLSPAIVLGVFSVGMLVFWPSRLSQRTKSTLTTITLGLFLLTGGFAFHVLYKYIQPTLLPKKVVPDGKPWVIEGNVFKENNYNNPVVIRLDDGRYRMYFHDSYSMMTAISDDGKKFTDVAKLFSGQMPTVIRLSDGRYRMYYFVNATVIPATAEPEIRPPGQQPMPHPPIGDDLPAPKLNLVSAVSNDGLTWTEEAGIRLMPTPGGYDDGTMIHPSVIQLADGTYKLYYDGEVQSTSRFALDSKHRRILSATSKDGLTWTKDPGYRIDEKPVHTWEAYSPKAMYQNGKVIVRFTTPNGIYRAESTDSINFTISQNPIFSPGKRLPMPDGPNGVTGSYQDSFVLPVEGGQRMYFWIAGSGTFTAFQAN